MNSQKDDPPALLKPARPMATINKTATPQYDRLISKVVRGRLFWVCEYCGTTVSCLTEHAGASSVCPACNEKVVYPRPEGSSEFGGIGRGVFAVGLGIYFGCAIFLLSRINAPNNSGSVSGVAFMIYIGALGLLGYLAHQRMINTGRTRELANKWFIAPAFTGHVMVCATYLLSISGIIGDAIRLGGSLAILSSYLCLFGLLVEQEGYVVSKRLDVLGLVLVAILVAVIALIVLVFIPI